MRFSSHRNLKFRVRETKSCLPGLSMYRRERERERERGREREREKEREKEGERMVAAAFAGLEHVSRGGMLKGKLE